MGRGDWFFGENTYLWEKSFIMDPIYIWLIIAFVLAAIEVMFQCMWAICLAFGCLGGIVTAAMGLSVPVQIGTTAVVSVIVFFTFMPVMRKIYAVRAESRAHRTGMEALLGRKATVTEEIRPGELGRARIDGDSWQVTAPGQEQTIRSGQQVVVTAYDSIILTVEPIS